MTGASDNLAARVERVTAPPRLSGAGPFAKRCVALAQDIKLSHTVFALPWALLSAFMAAEGFPRVGQILLILICMVTARTVAMAANRLLDARLDAANPRTAGRAIPSGRLARNFYLAVLFFCAALFVLATFGFYVQYENPWPAVLSLPVLLFLSAYPLLKRFTRLCHYYLGAALALAPVCTWLAIRGTLHLGENVAAEPLIMAAAVLLWTAGFDIIYACQDYESDLRTGVFSVPARVGVRGALWIARITHAGCAAMLILLGWHADALSTIYFVGAAMAIALLVVEHLLVRPDDLSKVSLAFFTVNGIISLLLGTLGIIDVFVQ